jgi:hypothetical protein
MARHSIILSSLFRAAVANHRHAGRHRRQGDPDHDAIGDQRRCSRGVGEGLQDKTAELLIVLTPAAGELSIDVRGDFGWDPCGLAQNEGLLHDEGGRVAPKQGPPGWGGRCSRSGGAGMVGCGDPQPSQIALSGGGVNPAAAPARALGVRRSVEGKRLGSNRLQVGPRTPRIFLSTPAQGRSVHGFGDRGRTQAISGRDPPATSLREAKRRSNLHVPETSTKEPP